MLKLFSRLSFEDADILYEVLNELAEKLHVPDYKSQMLTSFYDLVKVSYRYEI
jgi:hypothetical protein